MKKLIEDTVATIIDSKFDIQDCYYIPDVDCSQLTFGNKGLRFKATTLYIDMRESTKILNKHNRGTVAKLHMAYFHTIVKIAKSLGGEVRSFNGDGMLVFFLGDTKTTINIAVQAALQMKYMLTESSVVSKLAKYSALNYGIGVDHGTIVCTKVGIQGFNNRDLVWIGNPVNKAVKIGDKCKAPNHIGISQHVYGQLNDNLKIVLQKSGLGYNIPTDIWKSDIFTYNEEHELFYTTHFHYTLH